MCVPDVGALMGITTRCVEQRLNEKALSLGLTAAQMHMLHMICENDGKLHPKEIERHFDLTHATVSGILSRLESKGFLTMKPDPADGRAKCLFATARAKESTEAMGRYIRECEASMLQGFSEEETRLLRSYLTRILDNLDVKKPARFHPKEG